MNIRLRLTLWYTAILFFILVVFSVAVYMGLTRSLLVATDNHLQREVGEILGNLTFSEVEDDEHEPEEREGEEREEEDHEDREDEKNEPEVQPALTAANTNMRLTYQPEEGVFWRIFDANGQPLIDAGHFDDAVFNGDPLAANSPHFEYATLANGTPIRLYTAPFVLEGQGRGVIQVAENYRHIQEVQRLLIYLLALSIPFVLLAASLGGWFLASNALSPIDRITRTAALISADDLHQRLDLKLPNDEVGRLAATFDSMLARLQNAFEQQKRFIADASHELRTPLTILKGDVEVALNRPRSEDEYRHTLAMVNQTTDRLTALVEELFLLARADSNRYPLELEPLDLAHLLTAEISSLLSQAIKRQVSLHLDTPENIPMQGDPPKLTRLFRNLIENAIKYSPAEASVTVTAQQVGQQVRVDITDTGPGIPPEHLTHIFERFYRIDKARSREENDTGSSGAGLGLSIVQWLAQAHGGRIVVASRVGQGTTFSVWLPLMLPPDV